MRPRRTHNSTAVYRLAGGTEDNDLWVWYPDLDGSVVGSTWQPDEQERAAIAAGANIELLVWGGQPPVALRVDPTPLGKRPDGRPV